VHVLDAAGEPALHGTTDGHGVWSTKLEAAHAALVVRHPRYALLRVPVPSPAPAELVVQLDLGGAVRGRVQRAGAAAPGALVMMWPEDVHERRLTGAMARRMARQHPEALSVRADARGEFEIRGLALDRSYQAFAAANGAVADGIVRSIRAPRAGIELQLTSVFGAEIDLGMGGVGCEGALGNLQSPDSLHVADSSAVRLPLDLMPLVLDLNDASVDYVGHRPTFLFRSTNAGAISVGPVHLSVSRPGFAPRAITFECAPIVEGVSKVHAHLAATTSCFGSVVVVPPFASDDVRASYPGALRFSGESEITVSLRDVVSAGSACLPCGRYSVLLDSLSNGSLSSAGSLEIAAGSSNTLELPPLGALRIRVTERARGSFRGHLPVDISRWSGSEREESGSGHLDLWGPTLRDEYWIAALSPGIYSLSINGPFVPVPPAAHDGRGWIGPIMVNAGGVAELQLEFVGQ